MRRPLGIEPIRLALAIVRDSGVNRMAPALHAEQIDPFGMPPRALRTLSAKRESSMIT